MNVWVSIIVNHVGYLWDGQLNRWYYDIKRTEKVLEKKNKINMIVIGCIDSIYFHYSGDFMNSMSALEIFKGSYTDAIVQSPR